MKKILLLAASLRQDSYNKKLVNIIATQCSKNQNYILELMEFSDFIMPMYNGDIEASQGLPPAAQKFIDQLKSADGLIIASPEYNFSVPAPLKNLIDWVSRARPMPWLKYPIMLCSASPALAGGSRGLLHLTQILQPCCNACVFPPLFTIASAHEAFTPEGSLKDQELLSKLEKLLAEFMVSTQAIKQ